jgi:Coenzyme PQQ synthesis protein D (PqqD)
MQIERTNSNDLVVNGLPDGSRMIVDAKSEQVFALNATAGAAWDACSNPTTLHKVADDMRRSFGAEITDELAEQAILQLEEKNLVTVSGSSPKTTRRQALATLSAVALPLVVSMTLADQRAFAQSARSGGGDDDPDNHWDHHPKGHVSRDDYPKF